MVGFINLIGNVLECSLEIQNFNSSRIKRTQFQNLIFQGLFFEEYINKILGLCPRQCSEAHFPKCNEVGMGWNGL